MAQMLLQIKAIRLQPEAPIYMGFRDAVAHLL